jgi:hypothetical protein
VTARDCSGCGALCDAHKACPRTFYCDYPDDDCGDGASGKCVPIPTECAFNHIDPTACGCNGLVAQSLCVNLNGYDFSADLTRCASATFQCGLLVCKELTEYCEIDSSTLVHTCKPMPTACTLGVADCSCIPNGTGSSASCDQSNRSAVIVTL